MYTGFNLRLDKNAGIFDGPYDYKRLEKLGKNHLAAQKTNCENEFKKHVKQKEIDGTKIQNEWFPQIDADIFISHSHDDEELACALAGWINENFGLNCFVDSNVWGCSKELLDEMNRNLSNQRKKDGVCLYDHESCNQVSQHVNIMLSIALQKMIDKVETVILLNTDNAVKICSDTQMDKTYSPWIYSEIICTQLIRKKPLLAYRNYSVGYKAQREMFESVQFLMHADISYTVSLKHLYPLREGDLIKWENQYISDQQEYEYPLDALYEFMCPNEVESTKELFGVLNERELKALQHAYSAQDIESREYGDVRYVWGRIVDTRLLCCMDCDRFREILNE